MVPLHYLQIFIDMAYHGKWSVKDGKVGQRGSEVDMVTKNCITQKENIQANVKHITDVWYNVQQYHH